jgi:hypothetical protein
MAVGVLIAAGVILLGWLLARPGTMTVNVRVGTGDGGARPPAGVTLQAIDGGPRYFCSHGFTQTCNAGWDSPSFFPILVFNTSMPSAGDTSLINAYKNIGVNTFEVVYDNSGPGLGSTTLLQEINQAGMFVIGGADGSNTPPWLYTEGLFGTANPDTAVGYQWCDECDNTPNTSTKIQSAATLGETVTPTFNCGRTGSTQGMTPATLTEVLDDFHGAHGAGDPSRFLLNNIGGATVVGKTCYGQAHAAGYESASDVLSFDQYALTEGWRQGPTVPWQQYTDVQNVRSLATSDDLSKPIWFSMEAADCCGAPWSGVVATPALTAAEAWDGLIAGARGMLWFDYDFCSGAATNPVGCGYGTARGSPLTGSSSGGAYTFAQLQSQVGETDGLVKLLAPILNSPTANHYASSSVTGTGNTMDTMTKWEPASSSSSDSRCRDFASGCFYVFSSAAFNSTAQTATYTFKRNSACPATINAYKLLTDSTLSSPTSISVTSSGSNCQFTDSVSGDTYAALYVIPNE